MLTKDKPLSKAGVDGDTAAVATLAWTWRQFVRGIWGGVIAVLIVAACAAAYFLATPPQVFSTSIEFAREPLDAASRDARAQVLVAGLNLGGDGQDTEGRGVPLGDHHGFALSTIDFNPAGPADEKSEDRVQQNSDLLTAVFSQKASQIWNLRTLDLSKLDFSTAPFPGGVAFSTVGTVKNADEQKKLHKAITAELIGRIALKRKAAEDYVQNVLSNYRSDLADLKPLNLNPNATLAKYRSAEELDKLVNTLVSERKASSSSPSSSAPNISIADDNSIATSAIAMLGRREDVAASLRGIELDSYTLQLMVKQSHPEKVNYTALQTNQPPLVKNSLAAAAFIFLGLMALLLGPFVWATILSVSEELRAGKR